MSVKENILRFPPKEYKQAPNLQSNVSKKIVHPAVRRRRLFWFTCMVALFVWFIVELIVQQFRIWDKENEMTLKREQVYAAETQLTQIKQTIKKLKSEDYLLELAHKLGYSYPDEENYQIEQKK